MSSFLKKLICAGGFLSFLMPIGSFGQEKSPDEEKAFEGEVQVEYLPMERFIFLKRKGAVEELEDGYLLSKENKKGEGRSFLVHTDLNDALKRRPSDAETKKLYILYYNESTPDPEALQKKYEIEGIEMSSDDVSKKIRTLKVEEGELKE